MQNFKSYLLTYLLGFGFVRIILGAMTIAPQNGTTPQTVMNAVIDTTKKQAFDPNALIPYKKVENKEAPYDTSKLDFYKETKKFFPFSEIERTELLNEGFIASEAKKFGTFADAFETIYKNDLPVYISSDAILHTIDASYEDIMIDIESGVIAPKVRYLLEESSKALKKRIDKDKNLAQSTHVQDLDIYLTVGLNLINGVAVGNPFIPNEGIAGFLKHNPITLKSSPAFESNKSKCLEILNQIVIQKPDDFVQLGYRSRHIDFAQFTPRGRYLRKDEIAYYFQTMMWLGFTGWGIAPISETDKYANPTASLNSTKGIILFNELIQEAKLDATYSQVEKILQWICGESDDISLDDIREVAKTSGINTSEDLNGKQDVFLVNLRLKCGKKAKLPNHEGALVFKMFGQRITTDAHAQGIMTKNGTTDFAPADLMNALGNKTTALISPIKTDPTLLAEARKVIASPTTAQINSFYGKRLNIIQSLNPANLPKDKKNAYIPACMKTPSWSSKSLNTQLASWTYLRMDHVLNTKLPPMMGGCFFPHSYVEPNIVFYDAIIAYAKSGHDFVENMAFNNPQHVNNLQKYFTNLSNKVDTLKNIAQKQINEKALTAGEDHFLKCMIKMVKAGTVGYDTPIKSGWYYSLFYYGISSEDDKYLPSNIFIVEDQLLAYSRTHAFIDINRYRETRPPYQVKTQYAATGDVELAFFIAPNSNGNMCVYSGPVCSYYEGLIIDDGILTRNDWSKSLSGNLYNESETEKNKILQQLQELKRPKWVINYLVPKNLGIKVSDSVKKVFEVDRNFNGEHFSPYLEENAAEAEKKAFPIKKENYDKRQYEKAKGKDNNLITLIYPNPTHDYVTFYFNLKKDEWSKAPNKLDLKIFDAKGNLVKVIAQGINQPSENDKIGWDCTDGENKPVPAGNYYLQAVWNERYMNAKIVVVR